MLSKRPSHAFTLVEILVVVAVLAILLGLTTAGYTGWQRQTSKTSVIFDVQSATGGLRSHKNFTNDYPPNLAGINFKASNLVAISLWTNAPQQRTYSGLSTAENAQLFLNSCNANMPVTSGATTYNTSCVFSGNNVHVKGTSSSNVIINGPTVAQVDIQLTCGAACDSAESTMINEFLAQGGVFPLIVPKQQTSLPAPEITTYGTADKFCLEGRSASFTDLIYHRTNTDTGVQEGPCPDDPELHYP